ncbi:MAG: IceA2 protein, partial [Spartobacteria bacterium]|nr:IceA2 protein [Spartobacteria bacterium]
MKTVRVNNGRVEEFENGSIRRTFGTNISAAATDGQTVVAVTRAGRIETYVNGSI